MCQALEPPKDPGGKVRQALVSQRPSVGRDSDGTPAGKPVDGEKLRVVRAQKSASIRSSAQGSFLAEVMSPGKGE